MATERRTRASGDSPLRPRRPVGKVKPRRPRTPPWVRWVKRIAILAAALVALGIVGLSAIFWYYGRDLPDVSALKDYRPPQTTRVLDRNGKLVGEIYTERRTVVPREEIPRVMVLCTLAAEDADFYQHEGLDYPGMVRALLRDVLERRAAQGASTITQQVVKLMLLSSERTIPRKVKELILARRLEQELSKDEILTLYLNHINYGHGRYGVQEAAQYYYGKDAKDLTLGEATLICGVPQSPARLSPRTHLASAQRRQAYVLDQLAQKRAQYWPDLPAEDIDAAREESVDIVPLTETSVTAPEVLILARQELRDLVGEEAFAKGGYTVHTTVDLDLQEKARDALRKGLEALDARHGYRAPLKPPRRRRDDPPAVDALRTGRTYEAIVEAVDDEARTVRVDVGGHRATVDLASATRYIDEDDTPSTLIEEGARVHVSIVRLGEEDEESGAEARFELGPQAAAIVLDPRSRDVLAVIGSYERSAGFNRAMQAVRQPGSTFKPLVYALAIRSRELTPASVLLDAPAVYDEWRPANYETWRHEGAVRLRDALAKSINLVAVRVIEMVEPDNVVTFARQLGISTELDPSLSLALGASDVRPIELVNAYATIAAGGRWAEPRVIRKVEAPDGKTVALPAREPERDVLTPAEAYVVTSMLTSVVQDGTARRARSLGRPAAGKTGTSNEARDAWFVGYTPEVVAGVWVGFDDRRPLGRRESGGKAALPIWVDIVEAATKGRPVVEFPIPSGVVTASIDPASGLLAYEGMPDAVDEVFLEGTVPVETARPPDVADSATFLMEQLGGATSPDPAPEPSE